MVSLETAGDTSAMILAALFDFLIEIPDTIALFIAVSSGTTTSHALLPK